MSYYKATNKQPIPYRRVKTAAFHAGYTPRHVYRLIESGKIEHVDDDGLMLVSMSSLFAYIGRQEQRRT